MKISNASSCVRDSEIVHSSKNKFGEVEDITKFINKALSFSHPHENDYHTLCIPEISCAALVLQAILLYHMIGSTE